MKTRYGNFQAAAEELTRISGTKWSRQRVDRLFRYRLANGFPGLETVEINGHDHEYFVLKEVRDWYCTAEAAECLSSISGRKYKPSEVYHLWKSRRVTHFPDKKLRGRVVFDLHEVCEWYRVYIQDKNAG